MPKPYKSRIKLKEMTDNRSSVKRRDKKSISTLGKMGYISNPRDRSESLYRKGDNTLSRVADLKSRTNKLKATRQGASSIRSSKKQRTARSRAN